MLARNAEALIKEIRETDLAREPEQETRLSRGRGEREGEKGRCETLVDALHSLASSQCELSHSACLVSVLEKHAAINQGHRPLGVDEWHTVYDRRVH